MFHRGMSKSSGRSGGPKSGVRGKRVRGLASGLLLVSFLGAANIVAGPPASAATNVNVFVAYADNLRPSGFFSRRLEEGSCLFRRHMDGRNAIGVIGGANSAWRCHREIDSDQQRRTFIPTKFSR